MIKLIKMCLKKSTQFIKHCKARLESTGLVFRCQKWLVGTLSIPREIQPVPEPKLKSGVKALNPPCRSRIGQRIVTRAAQSSQSHFNVRLPNTNWKVLSAVFCLASFNLFWNKVCLLAVINGHPFDVLHCSCVCVALKMISPAVSHTALLWQPAK